MVVTAYVQRQLRHGVDVLQQLKAPLGMRAHQAEFGIRQPPGLVKQCVGNQHLADVMQQPSSAQVRYRRFVQFYLPAKIDHQGADRD